MTTLFAPFTQFLAHFRFKTYPPSGFVRRAFALRLEIRIHAKALSLLIFKMFAAL
jgi:hypothetical protein